MGIGSFSAKAGGLGGGGSGGFIHFSGNSPHADPLRFVFTDQNLGPESDSDIDLDADLSMYVGRARDRDFDFTGAFPALKMKTDYAAGSELSSDRHFAFDSALLTDSARQAVRVFCANELPALTSPGSELRIVGHTDRSGSADYNKTLSVNRAENVMQAINDVLGDKLKIPRKPGYKERGAGIYVQGRGESAAAAAGKPDKQPDADDRRVDVTLNSRIVLRLKAK